jgi:hypothetical protein
MLDTPGSIAAVGIAGAAYTNNDLNMDTGTTLFDIDSALDQVTIQSPPNNGSLVATGKLTVDTGTAVGFDIYTTLRKGVAVANTGFASLSVADTFGCSVPGAGHRHRGSTATIAASRRGGRGAIAPRAYPAAARDHSGTHAHAGAA